MLAPWHIAALTLWVVLVLGLLWAVGAFYRDDPVRGARHPFRPFVPGRVKRPSVRGILGAALTAYTRRLFRLLWYD